MPGFAIEVTLINKQLININKPTRSFKLHQLNSKIPSCQV